jgi:hypothetical protein
MDVTILMRMIATRDGIISRYGLAPTISKIRETKVAGSGKMVIQSERVILRHEAAAVVISGADQVEPVLSRRLRTPFRIGSSMSQNPEILAHRTVVSLKKEGMKHPLNGLVIRVHPDLECMESSA